MRLYLDADIFLALIKEEDRHKEAAQHFLEHFKREEFITSTAACLEVWFYLYKHGKQEQVLNALRAVGVLAKVQETAFPEVQTAALLAQQAQLSPADAFHAIQALQCDAIVSSDKAFDRVKGLKRVDFTKEG